jgi:peptide/nickel transport system permease protein
MINVMNADFITVAKAKGLPKRTIIFKHVLRNSILPVLTITAMLFASGLGGSVLIETVFSLPGLGRLILTAIINRDFPLISGTTTIYAIGVIIVTTFVDILQAFFDPRTRR